MKTTIEKVLTAFVSMLLVFVSCTEEQQTPETESKIEPVIKIVTDGEIIAGITEVEFANETVVEGTTVDRYYWHFGFEGTGNWSDKEIPGAVIYPTAGEFEVSLTVTGKDGNKKTATLKVTVIADNVAPVAEFTYQPDKVNVGEPVVFTCASTDSDGQIKSRKWTLPDGTESTDETVTYTFDKTGLYNITLSVTDDRGKTSEVTKAVSVSLAVNGLTLAWSTPVTSSIVEAQASVVAVSDLGYIYFTSTEGKIVALNTEGTAVWNYDAVINDGVAFTDGVSYPSVDTDGTVYWAASGDEKIGATPAYVYAFNGVDGSLKWKLLWGDSAIYDESSGDIEKNAAGDWFTYSTPLILDKHIVVAGRGNKTQITFLDKETGEKNCWVNPAHGRVPSVIAALKNYTFFHAASSANGYGLVVPNSTDENSWTNATFTAYDRANAYTKNEELKANNCQLCIDAQGNVYFAGTPDKKATYTLACAPVQSYVPGEAVKSWTAELAGGFFKTGAVLSEDGKTLYIISDSKEPYNVYAVNTSNGSLVWTFPLDADKSNSVPAVDNLGQIHFCTMGGYYCVIDKDGKQVYKEKVADAINGSPTISPVTGASYFVGTDAQSECLKVYSLLFPGVTGPAASAWAQYGQNARHCQRQK